MCLRQSVVKYIKKTWTGFTDSIFILFDKAMLGIAEDILFVCVYIHPERSSIKTDTRPIQGIDYLENCLLECISDIDTDDLQLIIMGDLNARTGSLRDFIINDDNRYIPSLEDMEYDTDTFQIPRCSSDNDINSYGRDLIDLCCSLGIHMMNGRSTSDPDGSFTCFSGEGTSLVDYCICTSGIYELPYDFKVHTRCESDHFPVTLHLKPVYDNTQREPGQLDNSITTIKRYRWRPEQASKYFDVINRSLSNYDLQHFMFDIVEDVNCAVDKLTCILTSCASLCSMETTERQQRAPKSAKWYDDECRDLKEKKYRCLNSFRQYRDVNVLREFRFLRNSYRNMCRNKKCAFEEQFLNNLLSSCNNSKLFWKQVKDQMTTQTRKQNLIMTGEWTEYFKNTFNIFNPVTDTDHLQQCEEYVDTHHPIDCDMCCYDKDMNTILNCDISDVEILHAIESLKDGKAAGPDSICPEMIKHCRTWYCHTLTLV